MKNLFEIEENHKLYAKDKTLPKFIKKLSELFLKNLIEVQYHGPSSHLLGAMRLNNELNIVFEWAYLHNISTKYTRDRLIKFSYSKKPKKDKIKTDLFIQVIEDDFISDCHFVFSLFENIRKRDNAGYIRIVGATDEVARVYLC